MNHSLRYYIRFSSET